MGHATAGKNDRRPEGNVITYALRTRVNGTCLFAIDKVHHNICIIIIIVIIIITIHTRWRDVSTVHTGYYSTRGKGGPRRRKIINNIRLQYYTIPRARFGLFQRTRDDVATMTLRESSEEKASPAKLTGKYTSFKTHFSVNYDDRKTGRVRAVKIFEFLKFCSKPTSPRRRE